MRSWRSTHAQAGLAALGTAAEQEEIGSAIQQMVAQAIGETGKFITYRLFKDRAKKSPSQILTQAVPEAKISSGEDPTQLMAWARPDDHTVIERIIDQLESESIPNKNFELRVYSVKSGNATLLNPLIGRAIPKAMVNPSSDPNRLIIWALPTDHAMIEKIVKQFDVAHAPEQKIEFYDVQKVDADAALRLVQTILQKQGSTGTTVTLIPGTHQLFVEARAEQHEQVRAALTGLKQIDEMEFDSFQLENIDPFAAETIVRRMFTGSRSSGPPPRCRLGYHLATVVRSWYSGTSRPRARAARKNGRARQRDTGK